MSSTNKNVSIVRIGPFQYIHILDVNTNVTITVTGPGTYICKENEKLVCGPEQMIKLGPMEYVVIKNFVKRKSNGDVLFDAYGQAQLAYGDEEYRFYGLPFPLYPGEEKVSGPTALRVVPVNDQLILQAKMSFTDSDGTLRCAGEKWCFKGPGTYYPRKEVEIVDQLNAIMIKRGDALLLKAEKDTVDQDGNLRVYGEQWTVRKPGAYNLGAYETLVETITGISLTENIAIHVGATVAHVDATGKRRALGEVWLITNKDTDCYLRSENEVLLREVPVTTLTARNYCILVNPITGYAKESGKAIQAWGQRRLVVGECSFFLNPGEELEGGVRDIFVLTENEGLVLTAKEEFVDYGSAQTQPVAMPKPISAKRVLVEKETMAIPVEPASSQQAKGIRRLPGSRWLLRGPTEYVPPCEVEVVCRRIALPLDENEGVYVRNIRDGRVRAVVGCSYMLTEDEELWAKPLPPTVQELLSARKEPVADRGLYACKKQAPSSSSASDELDLTRVVSFRVPHNAAVQVYDYAHRIARVVFGPDRILLGPDEQFTVLSLSGGKPKRPGLIKSLCLLLGPDFCTDLVVVETADHARLSLQLSYSWMFLEGANSTPENAARLFSVPDFVGDMCKAVASRIRGTVAAVTFDDFHKNSARIIRSSVFGVDENGKIRDTFIFPANRLSITNIDVQAVEPVDQRTRDSLMKSVQLAIEITTNSQEAAAKHEGECREQEARGFLERQRISDQAEAEGARRGLIELQVAAAALASTGQAKAEATSNAEAGRIEATARVDNARLKAQSAMIEAESELSRLNAARAAELAYLSRRNELELEMLAQKQAIEVSKFSRMVGALGRDTLLNIAKAAPDQEARLLAGLGLSTTLITDGNTPVNLLTTARGLVAGAMDTAHAN